MDRQDGSGKSPHAFMREAMRVQSQLLDQRRAFVTAALLADRSALNQRTGYVADEVEAYFDARIHELPAPPPPLRSWRR